MLNKAETGTQSRVRIIVSDLDHTRKDEVDCRAKIPPQIWYQPLLVVGALPADTPFKLINATKEQVISPSARLTEDVVAEGDALVVAPDLRAGGFHEYK